MSPTLLAALMFLREDMRANPHAFVSRTPLQVFMRGGPDLKRLIIDIATGN